MKEIKFRAWNPVYSKFIELDELCLWGGNGIDEKYADDDIKIMQYTGIKDKNGVEIYEGDIVECKQGDFSQVGKVNFVQGMFNWEYEEGKVSWLSEVVKKWKGKIIGNIYENPELLSN